MLVRELIVLSELAESEVMTGTFSQMAHDAHQQLWAVKNVYRRIYDRELCPMCGDEARERMQAVENNKDSSRLFTRSENYYD